MKIRNLHIYVSLLELFFLPTSLPDSMSSEVIIPISQQIFQISSSLGFPQSLPLSLTKINSSLSADIGLGTGIRKNPINKEKKEVTAEIREMMKFEIFVEK